MKYTTIKHIISNSYNFTAQRNPLVLRMTMLHKKKKPKQNGKMEVSPKNWVVFTRPYLLPKRPVRRNPLSQLGNLKMLVKKRRYILCDKT